MYVCHMFMSTDADKTQLTIQSVTVTPDEVKKGENVTIDAKFTLSKPGLGVYLS